MLLLVVLPLLVTGMSGLTMVEKEVRPGATVTGATVTVLVFLWAGLFLTASLLTASLLDLSSLDLSSWGLVLSLLTLSLFDLPLSLWPWDLFLSLTTPSLLALSSSGVSVLPPSLPPAPPLLAPSFPPAGLLPFAVSSLPSSPFELAVAVTVTFRGVVRVAYLYLEGVKEVVVGRPVLLSFLWSSSSFSSSFSLWCFFLSFRSFFLSSSLSSSGG